MKRIIGVALATTLLVACGGGPPVSTVEDPITDPIVVPAIYPVHFEAPGTIEFGNVHPGTQVDTWKADNVIPIEVIKDETGKVIEVISSYTTYEGHPLCLVIYNESDAPRQYSIELDGGNYGQPNGYTNWVEVSDWNPVIPAKSALEVPFRVYIPEDAVINVPKWELRFILKPAQHSLFQTAAAIRVIFNMSD